MLTELNGKGGRLCNAATAGEIRCPLMVRPTSEDVITGHLLQVLGVLNPRWWLSDMLNYGLGAPRFRRKNYRNLKIELWKNRGYFPRELLPWREGRTEVDVTISWENPATTIFLEMKYLSPLTKSTAGDDGSSGFPSDQLIRNARVGLLEAGWFDRDELFKTTPKDFCLLLVGPAKKDGLADRYHDMNELHAAIPNNHKLRGLPESPFVGQIDFLSISSILNHNIHQFSQPEKRLIKDLTDYLELKVKGPNETNK